MATQNFGCLRAFTAGSDMSGAGYRYRAMVLGATALLARATAGARAIGVLTDLPKSGEAGSVQLYDRALWEAGGAFDAGVQLASDSTGRAVAAVEGDFVLGISLEVSAGAGQIVGVELQPGSSIPQAPSYITLDIADGSADATFYLVMPFAGAITRIRTVIDGVVSTADITITASIGATPITNGVVTIATAGSAAGDVDVATPTAANTVTAGQPINLVVAGGGSGGSPRIHVVVELTP